MKNNKRESALLRVGKALLFSATLTGKRGSLRFSMPAEFLIKEPTLGDAKNFSLFLVPPVGSPQSLDYIEAYKIAVGLYRMGSDGLWYQMGEAFGRLGAA